MLGQLVNQAGILRRIGLSPFRQQKLLIEVRDGADATTVKGMFAMTETASLVSPGAAARVIVTTNTLTHHLHHRSVDRCLNPSLCSPGPS